MKKSKQISQLGHTHSLERNSANSNITELSNVAPICQRSNYWMSASGGGGATITNVSGSGLAIDSYPGTTFHHCDNAKVYGDVSPETLLSRHTKGITSRKYGSLLSNTARNTKVTHINNSAVASTSENAIPSI